jgi:hypothetical protein
MTGFLAMTAIAAILLVTVLWQGFANRDLRRKLEEAEDEIEALEAERGAPVTRDEFIRLLQVQRAELPRRPPFPGAS